MFVQSSFLLLLLLIGGCHFLAQTLAYDGGGSSSSEPFQYPELAASLNTSLDPCDNFYNFVCDGWMRSNPIDEDKQVSSQFHLNANLVEDRINKIWDDREHFHTLAPYDKMMFDMYDACMDNASRRAAKSSILLSNLKSLKQSRELRSITDWLIQAWPVTLFYTIQPMLDIRNTSNLILKISPNNVFPSEMFYIGDNSTAKSIPAMKKYLRKVLELLHSDDQAHAVFNRATKAADIERRVNAFIEVQVKMAQIVNGTDKKHYANVYEDGVIFMSLQELQDTLAKTIDWNRYMQSILPEDGITNKFPNGVGAAEVRIYGVELIKKFEYLTRNLSGQTLSDYMDWKVILSEVGYLDDRYLNAQHELNRALGLSEQKTPRWKECKHVASTLFPALIERVYIHRHMEEGKTKATKHQMEEMFANVKKSFHKLLDENSWMDATTKAGAVEKLTRMNALVGYTDAIFNDTKLRKHYEEYDVHPDQPFSEIVFSLTKLIKRNAFLQLLEPFKIEFTSLVINAFYVPEKNSIVLPGGILQGAFFNVTRPISLNYGSIGVILGHEITHGFDNNGRLRDQFGNVRNWWENRTANAFQHQTQCFVDQYNAVPVPGGEGLHINGNLTQSENIADNGGMRAAFAAMSAALAANHQDVEEKERRVKGLEQFSPEQLFFINYAFTWCTNKSPAATKLDAMSDSHSPQESRVNVVLGNLPQFAEHFNCPSTSAMNLANKSCSVW